MIYKNKNVNYWQCICSQHQASGVMIAKSSPALGFGLSASDGHMTPEEVERHLQSRQSYLELLPERAPPTVPTEMFSNDPSLDRFVQFYYFSLKCNFSYISISVIILTFHSIIDWAF